MRDPVGEAARKKALEWRAAEKVRRLVSAPNADPKSPQIQKALSELAFVLQGRLKP